MVELERKNVRSDPEREAKVWLDKLVEAERKRSGFQDMAAEGLITFDELREKLASLEESRRVAEEELKAWKPSAHAWNSWSKIRKRCLRPTRRWHRRALRRLRRRSGNGCIRFFGSRCLCPLADPWRSASARPRT